MSNNTMEIVIADSEKERALKDLLSIMQNKFLYTNEKGYLQKAIDLAYKFGYYKDNESIMTRI